MIMMANFDSILSAGPMNQTGSAIGVNGSSPGRQAAVLGKPWSCPVPTLEGLPRFSTTTGKPTADKSALKTVCTALVTATNAACGKGTAPAGAADDFLLRLYFRDLQREPQLTPAEQIELGWLASFDDDDARRGLVVGNLRLVVHITSEFRGLGLSLSDLISEGNLGLMRAAELFEPVHGLAFSNYAGAWIRQRMRRALSRQAWPMRMPVNFAWQHRPAEAQPCPSQERQPADGQAASECDPKPSTAPQSDFIGFPRSLPLHNPLADDEEGQTLADILPDEQTPSPDEALARRSDCEFAGELLATLKPREQNVLRLRFGLDDGLERTHQEVGNVLGYVRQGIHKIESAALIKLRRQVKLHFADERG